MRILFSAGPWAYGNGPIGQCLEVARCAFSRGHICLFVASPKTHRLIEQEHFEIVETFESQNKGKYPNIAPVFFSDFLAAGGFLNEAYLANILEREMALLTKLKPDAIFSVWHITLHAIAELFGIPVFASTFYPDHPTFSTPLFPRLIQKPNNVEISLIGQLKHFGAIRPIQFASDLIFKEPTIPICAFPKGFDRLLEINCKRLHVVGPIVHDYEIFQDRGRYCYKQKQIHDKFCLAYLPDTAALNWLLLSETTRYICNYVRPMLAPAMQIQHIPSRWRLCRHMTFQQALQAASIFICHGGFGGILMALKSGCPILAIPGNDPEREYVSSCVERLGLGIVLRELSLDALQAALRTLMRADISSRVRNYSNRFSKEDGATNVVRLMEKYSFKQLANKL